MKFAMYLATWLSLVAASTSSTAQAPASSLSKAKTVWSLDYREDHCTITTGDLGTIAVSLWMTPGDPDPELYLAAPATILRGINRQVAVELAPSGQRYLADVSVMSKGSPRILKLGHLGSPFRTEFVRSTEVRLLPGDRVVSAPIKGAAKADAALQQCIDAKLPEWGVDPKALASLRAPSAVIDSNVWISGDDYPLDAINSNFSGRAIVRLNVDAAGNVTECAVLVRSGLNSIDQTTCRRSIEKRKFKPAIGSDGRPTASVRVQNVIWRLEN